MSQQEIVAMQAELAKVKAELAEQKANQAKYEDDFFLICNQSKGKSGTVIIGYASLIDSEYKGEMRRGLLPVLADKVAEGNHMVKVATVAYTKEDGTKCRRVGFSCFGKDGKKS